MKGKQPACAEPGPETSLEELDVYRTALRPPPRQPPDPNTDLPTLGEEAGPSSAPRPQLGADPSAAIPSKQPLPRPPQNPEIIELRLGFDLHSHEIAIGFDTARHARLYQRRNPEARILLDSAPRQVLLPLHEGTETLTCVPGGMVLVFGTRAQAVRWTRRTLLARLDERSGAAAMLPRTWVSKQLTDIIVPGASEAKRLGALVEGDAARAASTEQGKGRVTLSGAQETLLLTLLARADDAESAHPILNDTLSAKIRKRIQEEHGYRFRERIPSPSKTFMAKLISARAKIFDEATEKFLRKNPGPATVLHLACGMDTRCHRVKWQGPGRVWIDVDKKDVVELRRAVVEDPDVPQGQGEYRLECPDIINDADWLRDIRVPNDRPVLIMFEGLVMYLNSEMVLGLFSKIMRHFEGNGKGGEIHFDSMGAAGYFFLNIVGWNLVRNMGATFDFYMSNGQWLELHNPGLRQVNRESQAVALIRIVPYLWIFRVAVEVIDYLVGGTLLGGVYEFKF
ncbi:hypothetical protein MCOR30_002105 [Pyricularia oryzae]|nr:hypothetical protein MCOR30_002105 [Pyricularia oryzae]